MTGVHSTCASSSTHGVVSPSHPLSPAHLHHASTLQAVAHGGGVGCWSFLVFVPHPLIPHAPVPLTHSTPFHPTSNCSWQRLGVLHGVGFIVSPPPSSLSTHLSLILLSRPPLILYGGGSTSLVSLSSHVLPLLLSLVPAGIVLVLAASWCSCRFAGRGCHISSTCNDRTMLVFLNGNKKQTKTTCGPNDKPLVVWACFLHDSTPPHVVASSSWWWSLIRAPSHSSSSLVVVTLSPLFSGPVPGCPGCG
jgi:hypothetical protein